MKNEMIEFRSLLWPPNAAEFLVVRPSLKSPRQPRPRDEADELVDGLIAKLLSDAKPSTERQ
ncbi:MAG: hypothetical protein ABH861_01825 [Patescibacteria group bacterium]|nr:hypothetical protein [Patescibacteria group bacterium]